MGILSKFWGNQQDPNDIETEIVPLFARRNKGQGFSANLSATEWTGVAWGLEQASSIIDTGQLANIQAGECYSMPDALAPILFFGTAVTKKGHSASEVLKGRWRTTLTLILLSNELMLNVESDEMDFGTLENEDPVALHAIMDYLGRQNHMGGKIKKYYCRDVTGGEVTLAFSSGKFIICPVKRIGSELPKAPSKPVSYNINFKETELKDAIEFLKANKNYAHKVYTLLGDPVLRDGVPDEFLRGYVDDFRSAISNVMGPPPQHPLGLDNPISISKTGGLSPKDVFTDFIMLFPKDEPYRMMEGRNQYFSHCHGSYAIKDDKGNEMRTALLPLRKNFVTSQGFDSATGAVRKELTSDLDSTFWMEYVEEGGNRSIRANFKFNGQLLPKIYTEDKWLDFDEDSDDMFVPPIAVWPNKVDPAGSWKPYYVFERVDVRNVRKELSFSVVSSNSDQTKSSSVFEDEGAKYKITKTLGFPYFLYGTKGANDVGVLIAKPAGALPKLRTKQIFLGIDFGTTNTTACIAEQSSSGSIVEQKPVSFGPSASLIVTNYQEALLPVLLYFVAMADKSNDVNTDKMSRASFMTILRTHGGDKELSRLEPVWDAGILFEDMSAISGRTENAHTDLKWGITPQERGLARAFVTHYTLMCIWNALESGAGNVYLRYSYASSLNNLSDYETTVLKGAAVNAMNQAFGTNNPQLNGKISDGLPTIDNCDYFEFTSENHAAGLYFRKNLDLRQMTSLCKGFVIVDIGGGSTDISFWQAEKGTEAARAETSLAFAGNKMFANNVQALGIEKITRQLGLHVDNTAVTDGSYITKFISALQMTYNEGRGNVPRHQAELSRSDNKESDPLKTLIKMIEFNMAALVAFTGFMMKDLIDDGVYIMPSGGMDIVLCGNGSKLKDWTNSNFENILRTVFRRSANLADSAKVSFILADNPKNVVAYGLVAEQSLQVTGVAEREDYYRKKSKLNVVAPLHDEEDHAQNATNMGYDSHAVNVLATMVDVLCNDEKYVLSNVPGWNNTNEDSVKAELQNVVDSIGRTDAGFTLIFVRCLERLNRRFTNGIQ